VLQALDPPNSRLKYSDGAEQSFREENDMAKYLLQGGYTREGLQGLMKEGGSSRRAAYQKAIEGLGGKIDAYYFAFGSDDVIVIADLPDNVSAAAIALATGASGAANVRTTVLLTPEEIDAATKKGVDYRKPGG